ncbi:MAG: mechanosensitive ion channel family protein [Eubacteriales bacterium]|nr:mechanosensitive ion channel family protein [Eubacteriales bacterium]
MQENKKKRFPIGKLIAIALIAGVAAAVANPRLLFFLTPAQQSVVTVFRRTYLTGVLPLSGPKGGFDWLRLLALAVLAAFCWAVCTLVNAFHKKVKLKSRHAETLKGLACNCVKYAVVILGLIFGLSILGVNMVAVIASLGILGLVVGFGAQTLIEDVITGLFIIFEGQFHVGDIITIDGFRGTVVSIGIRTTRLMDVGGNIKIINNSDIRTLTNLSEVESYAVTTVGISYGASIPDAEAAVRALLDKLPSMYPDVFKAKPEYSGVESLSASSVDLRIVAKVEESQLYRARRLLNRELKLCLDEAGVEIPFPQVVVHQGE